MKRLLAVVLGVVATTMATEVIAYAQEDETVVTVKTTTTVRAEGLRLMGRIAAPFTPRGEGSAGQDCVSGRQVELLIKRPRGYRTVGTTLSSPDGAWSLRARELDERYRIEIDGVEFAYSPSYGQLETVRCSGAMVVGWLRRRGFRIDRVLGERFTRAAPAPSAANRGPAGRLPTTGSPVDPYSLGGVLLIALGTTLLRVSSREGAIDRG
jgi:hypothetical protein